MCYLCPRKLIFYIDNMNKILFTLLVGFGCTSLSAQQYEISGLVPEGVQKVYLRNYETRQVDSTSVVNGKFAFEGDAKGNLFAHVYIDKQQDLDVILDGTITVDFAKSFVLGTAEVDSLTAWGVRLNPAVSSLKTLQQQAQAMRSEGSVSEVAMRELSVKYDSIMAIVVNGVKQLCSENLQLKFPALYLGFYGSYLGNDWLIDYAAKNPASLQTSLLSRLTKAIEGWKNQKVGADVVDFVMADTTGIERHLTEFVGKGKYVLVDFWASWCGPCRQEMPEVKKIYEQYKGKGFDIVGVSLDNNKKAWVGAINKMELPWHHISDLKGWQCEGAAVYGINAIPATILYGPDGKVIAAGLRAHELAEKLAEVFK